jgi:hypothetical protein
MTGEVDTTTLKTGAIVPSMMVPVTRMSLDHLLGSNPIAFYELVQLCRDNTHELFGNTRDTLRGLSLIESDGLPHDVVRQIVLSSVYGEGLGLWLTSPVANERNA